MSAGMCACVLIIFDGVKQPHVTSPAFPIVLQLTSLTLALMPAAGTSGQGAWLMQIYNVPDPITQTPTYFASSALFEQSTVPAIALSSLQDFSTLVPGISADNFDFKFAWRFFGVLSISLPGSYTLCTTSDDGSMVFISYGSAGDATAALADFSLIINDDGRHPSLTSCASLDLGERSYSLMVRLPAFYFHLLSLS